MPLLSIVTVCFNAERFIASTLQSIQFQTCKDFEYIIIDGASTDRTLSVIQAYPDIISDLISEKDKGIYDAMNKGLKRANGDYVWFMNAGDKIAENDTVERLIKTLKSKPDIVYSDTEMIDESGKVLGLRSKILPHKLPMNLSWEKYNMGMLVCHQSFIAKKLLAPEYITNNLSADIDWEIRCLKNSRTTVQYPGILSRYLMGGVSQQQHWQSLKDRYKVLQHHFGVIPNLFNHLKIIFRKVGSNFIKSQKNY